MHRSIEQSVVVTAGTAAVLWVTGVVFLLAGQAPEVQRLGILLVVVAATVTALGLLRSWQLRMHRAFVHGYHAGFHDGTGQVKRPAEAKDCDVLELSEIKARRMSQLG